MLVGRQDRGALESLRGSTWEGVPVRSVAERAGDHQGAGGFAVVAAAAAIAAGHLPAALVLGHAKGRGYALLLAAVGERSA